MTHAFGRHLAILAALLSAAVFAQAAPIQCKKGMVGIEGVICENPGLRETDGHISDVFGQLLSQCPAAKRAALTQSQKFWLRDRNYCWNGPEITGRPIDRCVAERMAERLNQFDRIGSRCDLDAVAAEYRYVDPDYLLQFGDRYLDRQVTVAGTMFLGGCDSQASDGTGYLAMADRKRQERFPVRFKAMPDREREFLCAQHPFSHWTGTVRRGERGNYLYLDNVLGSPL
jgi:uncharacterized protein YecT (DUF1311 family)